MLLAPLASQAGGYGRCRTTTGGAGNGAIFKDTRDEGYQAILAMISAGKSRLEAIKRFDMAGYRPPEPYLGKGVKYVDEKLRRKAGKSAAK